MSIRENWRILLLVLFVVLSGVALFAPEGGGSSGANNTTTDVNSTAGATQGPTNLQFGLELSGGTRIRAPLIGLTAENAQFDINNSNIEQNIATNLSVSRQDVTVQVQSQDGGTVEIFNPNVTKEEFATALQASGVDVQQSDIRDGVTQKTRENAVRVLDRKIKGAGLSGGDAAIVTSATGGESFIVVEVPNKQPQEVVELIDERGTVQVVAHFPENRNDTREYRDIPLFSQEGIANSGPVEQRGGETWVPLTLTDAAARNFSHAMRTYGFTERRGIQQCFYYEKPNNSGHCLYTVSNGRVVNGTITEGRIVSAAGMGRDLAPIINNREFVQNPDFRITTSNASEAQNLLLNLQAGALPAELDISSGTSTFIQPSLAQKFKTYSLVTGIIAMFAVGGMVGFRYREPQVVLPMVLTAAAEVFILLGFSAAIGLALDLSHIAGFIAVIGTGVDDLVIIADEILQQGDVSTGRVFRSRFRKAFWVIGAAAATTIVAMLPLSVLSLGDLQGFAFVTIVGVLIGVLVTRPAYGDILRNLIMDRS
ncbi:preprotein translocase subunit SecD [Halocatena marina]|uniref:preprotein translocase subunit SecD n=1 Tax=Halocatena marina TaxID=2934937 RepID=UPI00200D6EAC|nr:preprotein translocase subunit SecD [Halocatena marina]